MSIENGTIFKSKLLLEFADEKIAYKYRREKYTFKKFLVFTVFLLALVILNFILTEYGLPTKESSRLLFYGNNSGNLD